MIYLNDRARPKAFRLSCVFKQGEIEIRVVDFETVEQALETAKALLLTASKEIQAANGSGLPTNK